MSCDQLQQWADNNGVEGIRFYPLNASASSAEDLLESAKGALSAFQQGKVIHIADCVTSSALDETTAF